MFPKAKESLTKAIEAGVKVACGTDAPAIFHGRNAEELDVLVKRGMTPIQAIRAATTVAAELIDAPDLGRIAPEMLADIIGVTGDPLTDITHPAGAVRHEGRHHLPTVNESFRLISRLTVRRIVSQKVRASLRPPVPAHAATHIASNREPEPPARHAPRRRRS